MDALTERARPRWGRLLKRIWVIAVGAATAGVALMLIISADARYIARAGIEEARLLLRRRPLDKLIADTTMPAALRQRFALVLAARAYAADSLGLAVGKTYTTYVRSEEHTSELQSLAYLVCRLLLEKKKIALADLERVRHGHAVAR